jgi:glycosyltransferase involved in cell wall biosynthesis
MILEGDRPLPERRLSVLLACWEVPCSRHGGGVCMVNLLRYLGTRHDITLLHSLAPGEEGLSEEVRPFVREILGVRREWRERAEGADFGVPPELARNWSPRVREVIEAELATGAYDLVNYEFNPMVLHTSGARDPALGVLHEVHSFARVAVLPPAFGDAESAAAALAGVVESLHFETVVAPRAFREVTTLTREEAEFLARWLPGARLFVSPIPIDVARFDRAAAARPAGSPTFVFVGNYIHEPNREAARLLASRVAPAALALRPDLRFVIAGPHPPDELRELARPPGIQVAGFVPDLEGLLASATAFVAPIVSGGGLRVKLLEAMAGGCAVVSTPLGLNGIPAEPGREVVRVAAIDDFAGAVLRLANEAGFARRVGAAGRALVERVFGITAQGERRERIWRAVLDAAPQR